MASFKLFDQTAKEVGKISLKNTVFDAEYKPYIIHEVVVAIEANNRQGTQSTLTRSEVKGGKKKPYRQKGTGYARQGSTVGPHQTGGGVAFAPKPRDYNKKINREVKKQALLSALSEKARTNEIIFVDKLSLKQAKTKDAQAILDAFKLDKSVLVVLDANDLTLRRALKNIPNVKTILAKQINTLEIVNNRVVLMTQASAKLIEEAYA